MRKALVRQRDLRFDQTVPTPDDTRIIYVFTPLGQNKVDVVIARAAQAAQAAHAGKVSSWQGNCGFLQVVFATTYA